MAKQLVLVYQPSCANLFLVDGSERERLVQNSPAYCHAFATGYDRALNNRFEYARVAFCADGDAKKLEWNYTGTREVFPI